MQSLSHARSYSEQVPCLPHSRDEETQAQRGHVIPKVIRPRVRVPHKTLLNAQNVDVISVKCL